jgi:hypothetical protein
VGEEVARAARSRWCVALSTGQVDSPLGKTFHVGHSLHAMGTLIRRKPKKIILSVNFFQKGFWSVFGNLRISVRIWDKQGFLRFESLS